MGSERLSDVTNRLALREVVTSRAGKTPNRATAKYWGGEVPWVTAKDLKTHRLRDSQERITATAVAEGAPLAEPGSVLVLVRGMTLMKDVPVALVESPMSYNQDVRCLRPTRALDGEYLSYLLAALRDELLATVTQAGHGTGRIDGDQLLDTTVPIPPFAVQRWLAAKLSTFDRILTTLKHLVEAKRAFKRALLHEVLTGRRRFPEFGADAWATERISDLFAERNEFGAKAERLLSVTADRGVIPRDQLDRRDTSSADKSKYKRVLPGDIAYNTMRMWQGVSGIVRQAGIVSPAYTVLAARGPLSSEYAKHMFKHPKLVHTFWRYSQGLVDDTLSLKYPNFARIEVSYPSSKEEQERIAGVLDQVDREIALLERLRATYEVQKRALLHRLLSGDLPLPASPEPEAVHV